jgi:endonuclease YncB( thermonuclease family)
MWRWALAGAAMLTAVWGAVAWDTGRMPGNTARDAGRPPGSDAAAGTANPGPPPDARTALVVRVVDGDTLLLRIGGRRLRVRLIGVDAPETWARRDCYGAEAARALRRLVPAGSEVRVIGDREPYDHFGRRLLHLWTSRGRLVGAALVRADSPARWPSRPTPDTPRFWARPRPPPAGRAPVSGGHAAEPPERGTFSVPRTDSGTGLRPGSSSRSWSPTWPPRRPGCGPKGSPSPCRCAKSRGGAAVPGHRSERRDRPTGRVGHPERAGPLTEASTGCGKPWGLRARCRTVPACGDPRKRRWPGVA